MGPASHDTERLLELLRRLGRRTALRDPISASLEAELSSPQLHSLLWLGSDGPTTMGELAARVGATEKTITGIVDRLEREGLGQRLRDPEDRRVVRAALTPRGEATFQELYRDIQEQVGRFLGLLDARDRSDLFRILDRLLEKVEGAHPPKGTAR